MFLNFTAIGYALLFLNSEIYIIYVINCEWSRSINFLLHMFCMRYKLCFSNIINPIWEALQNPIKFPSSHGLDLEPLPFIFWFSLPPTSSLISIRKTFLAQTCHILSHTFQITSLTQIFSKSNFNPITCVLVIYLFIFVSFEWDKIFWEKELQNCFC